MPVFSLKISILIPLTLTLMVLISLFVYGYTYQEKMYTKKYIGEEFLVAEHAFTSGLTSEEEKLSALLTVITADSALKQTMIAGDRNGLLQQSIPNYKLLREKYGITHFYFHLPDRTNFLRVHQPERHGDRIDRFSALKAEATGKPASALEVGPLGYLTLRMVFPWYQNGNLIGYIELGEEIEHLYTHIKKISNLDLYVTLNKQILSQQSWESSMKAMGRKAAWNLLPDSVVIFTTLPESNRTLYQHLIQSSNFDQIPIGNTIYETFSLPLNDPEVADHEIGRIYFAHDVTALKQQTRHHLYSAAGIGALLGGVLIMFFYLLTRRVEKRLELSSKNLLHSEERFRSLVESSSDWIWEVDVNGRYLYSSPKVKEILGYEVDEIIGKTPFDLMGEKEAARPAAAFSVLAQTHQPFTGLENITRHKDGRIIILETSGVPIINENGLFTGYRGIDRDITRRKNDEENLQKASQRLLLHFQQNPLGVIEWDTDFKVVKWNPAAERIFGYSEQEALNRSAEELILAPTATVNVSEIWQKLLSGEEGYRGINENRTKNGKRIFCEWYNTPLKNGKGEIIGVASVVDDITVRREATEKIQHMAYYDTLTELPNRVLFKDRLEQNCLEAKRNKGLVTLLFIDIDSFKNVNDTLGHIIGDLLLIAVATRLKEKMRATDTVARLGGDEFGIIITELKSVEDMEGIIQSLFEKIQAPFKIYEHEFFITVSIGSSTYPHDDLNADNLIRNADTAMFWAKKMGRNQHQCYQKAMTDQASTLLLLQNDLRKAIQNEELILFYQPQMELKSGTIIGAEALIRWNHPEEGLKSPAEFIAIAEETGLIVPMGEWILRSACLQIQQWQEQGLPPFIVAVNLSARQFKEEGFAQSVIQIIRKSGVDPHRIELELTESILAENAIEVNKSLHLFKQAGVRISLDDFGTGYSSLSYLKFFPIDKLKIDQSFVRDLLIDKNDASLIRAIIAMAKALELTTIAEGVETKEQLDFFEREGCNEIQGYFLAKPMPSDRLQQFIEERYDDSIGI